MYNIYETIPPLDTTWYTLWAKVIVIVATYRRVITLGYLWCSFFCYTVVMRDFLCKVYDKLYCFLGYADM